MASGFNVDLGKGVHCDKGIEVELLGFWIASLVPLKWLASRPGWSSGISLNRFLPELLYSAHQVGLSLF